MPGADLEGIVEHGRNGWLIGGGGPAALGARLAEVLAAPPGQREAWRARARSAAGVWGMPDIVAARLVAAYCDATDALRRRIRRVGAGEPTLASLAPPVPEHRFTLCVQPGGRLLLLGFRSANGQWGGLLEASWEHGWRLVTPPGAEPAMEAYGAQGAVARFVVRASQLEIGFWALQGPARVDLASGAGRRTIEVQAETWVSVGAEGA